MFLAYQDLDPASGERRTALRLQDFRSALLAAVSMAADMATEMVAAMVVATCWEVVS